jgi:hypothetical protein
VGGGGAVIRVPGITLMLSKFAVAHTPGRALATANPMNAFTPIGRVALPIDIQFAPSEDT